MRKAMSVRQRAHGAPLGALSRKERTATSAAQRKNLCIAGLRERVNHRFNDSFITRLAMVNGAHGG
jgi:hypothetical protein